MPLQRKRCYVQPKTKTGEDSQSKSGEHSRSKASKKNDRDIENHEPERLISPEKVKNKNVVNFLKQSQSGNISSGITDRIKQWATIKQVAEFSGIQEVYDYRITAICWHHSLLQQNLLAVGIKDGAISIGKVCLLTREYKDVVEFDKIGKGNAIYSIKFDPKVDEVFYSACWNGTVTAKNIEKSTSKLLLTKTYENQWFTTLDVSKDGDFLVSGCTNGLLHVFGKDSKKIFTGRIHPQRILSVELCPRDKNLLATSSLDKTVKLWDLRYIKDKSSYIISLKHKSPPCTATFSLHGCNQLLTSDQSREVRVYSASNWKLLNVIGHPHRHFMHITPIKASWHPKSDVIVVGRYPDKTFEPYIENEPRTIDFFCPNTGKMLYQLLKPGLSDKISSLNVFNSTGNMMASGRGDVLVLWSNFLFNDG